MHPTNNDRILTNLKPKNLVKKHDSSSTRSSKTNNFIGGNASEQLFNFTELEESDLKKNNNSFSDERKNKEDFEFDYDNKRALDKSSFEKKKAPEESFSEKAKEPEELTLDEDHSLIDFAHEKDQEIKEIDSNEEQESTDFNREEDSEEVSSLQTDMDSQSIWISAKPTDNSYSPKKNKKKNVLNKKNPKEKIEIKTHRTINKSVIILMAILLSFKVGYLALNKNNSSGGQKSSSAAVAKKSRISYKTSNLAEEKKQKETYVR